jgi:hypothetical protein
MKEDGHSASDSALAAIVTKQLGSDIYRSADTAFSPFFSNMGLTFDGTLGVCDCVLYHNRHAVGVNTPLLAILRGGKPLVATETETAMMGIVQKARLGQGGSVVRNGV